MNLNLGLLRRPLVPALVGLWLLVPAPVSAGWHFTTINGPVVKDTEIYGITNDGLVTGFTYDASGQGHGFLWRNGVMKIVDYPRQGPVGTYFYQANQKGQVAGGYYDNAGIAHALIYDVETRKFKVLPDIPGATISLAGGITDDCVLAGNYTTDPAQTDNYVAWIFGGGRYHDSVDPASDQAIFGTITQELNDHYDLVGYYLDANNVAHGFLKPLHGPYIPIDIKGADNTEAYGINNHGVITGRYMTNGTRHGFLLHDGRVITIDVPGATQTWVTAINDDGVIGGFYEDAAGNYHGYVARYAP
jgi:probable HAF family extracellular repeat protein